VAGLSHHVPNLLARARALLRLPGGPPGELAPAELSPAVRAVDLLHRGLVAKRELARASTYSDPTHLGAYLLWWWPQTYAKVRGTLDMARAVGALLPARPRVLDVGSGPGPAAIAVLDALAGKAVAVDASEAALGQARALSHGAIETRTADLSSRALRLEGSFDLVVVANALSELPVEARVPLIERLPLAPKGAIVIVEPALRETGRALLEVRDELLRHGWMAAAPCLTQQPCPALQNPRDWCTAQHAWDAPRHVVQLADELGLRADLELSYAPLVLVRRVAAAPRDVWRVVGVPQPEKGKKRLFLCSDEGRVPAVRLDRDASPANEEFDRLGRGDLLALRGPSPKGDGLRVGRDAQVQRLDRVPRGDPA
jgi:ribosomal protein RSM22 (predicted rRNA methylase)